MCLCIMLVSIVCSWFFVFVFLVVEASNDKEIFIFNAIALYIVVGCIKPEL